MTLLTPELMAMVGLEACYTAPEELGRASIRYFAVAVGDHNPLYTDDADGALAPALRRAIGALEP